jgi:dethiobiotin synthetase
VTVAVVGTDTGVGKTVVTAALVARLRAESDGSADVSTTGDAGPDTSPTGERGSSGAVRAIKPAQTAYPEDDDAGYVRWACADDAAGVTLRTYSEPLAPAVAARRAGEPIVYDRLLADTRAAMAATEAIVEGAGGLRVPLSNEPRREIVDLVADLNVPALVVARSGLGTLNHSALTVEALRTRDIPVLGVVLNRYEGGSVAERTNPAELERMCGCPVWTLPTASLDDPADVRALGDRLPAPTQLLSSS